MFRRNIRSVMMDPPDSENGGFATMIEEGEPPRPMFVARSGLDMNMPNRSEALSPAAALAEANLAKEAAREQNLGLNKIILLFFGKTVENAFGRMRYESFVVCCLLMGILAGEA